MGPAHRGRASASKVAAPTSAKAARRQRVPALKFAGEAADTPIMRTCILLALTASLPGCCHMLHGTTQTIPIVVRPSDAKVTVTADKPNRGVTVAPGMMILERKGNYVVHVAKDGYQPADLLITHHHAGRWRNIVWVHPLGIGAGLIVDEATGAGYELSPETPNVTLTPSVTRVDAR
jgi:hypothetical protein